MSIAGIGASTAAVPIKPHAHHPPHHNPGEGSPHSESMNIFHEQMAHQMMEITYKNPLEDEEEEDYEKDSEAIHKAHETLS